MPVNGSPTDAEQQIARSSQMSNSIQSSNPSPPIIINGNLNFSPRDKSSLSTLGSAFSADTDNGANKGDSLSLTSKTGVPAGERAIGKDLMKSLANASGTSSGSGNAETQAPADTQGTAQTNAGLAQEDMNFEHRETTSKTQKEPSSDEAAGSTSQGADEKSGTTDEANAGSAQQGGMYAKIMQALLGIIQMLMGREGGESKEESGQATGSNPDVSKPDAGGNAAKTTTASNAAPKDATALAKAIKPFVDELAQGKTGVEGENQTETPAKSEAKDSGLSLEKDKSEEASASDSSNKSKNMKESIMMALVSIIAMLIGKDGGNNSKST
jgi:hypothetical protein